MFCNGRSGFDGGDQRRPSDGYPRARPFKPSSVHNRHDQIDYSSDDDDHDVNATRVVPPLARRRMPTFPTDQASNISPLVHKRLSKVAALGKLAQLDFGTCGDDEGSSALAESVVPWAERGLVAIDMAGSRLPMSVPKLSLSGALSQPRDGGMFDPSMQMQ